METKICTQCKRELGIDNFCRNKYMKSGINNYCNDCNRENVKSYYNKNKEKELERKRKSYIKNFDKEKIRHSKWFSKNKDKTSMAYNKYRSTKLSLPFTLTTPQWNTIKSCFNNKCAYCGRELPLAKEHFIALSKLGECTINNIIPSCRSCNSSKRDKDFFEWYPKYRYYSKKREKIILHFLHYENEQQQLTLAL